MKRTVKGRGTARSSRTPVRNAHRVPAFARSGRRRAWIGPGFSLLEVLVVLTIIAIAAGFITISILNAMKQQGSRTCLTNMLTIEAAKDEYARDHPGQTAIPSVQEFAPYFRFGIPRCPDNQGTDYANLLDLRNQVTCSVHPENSAKLNAGK